MRIAELTNEPLNYEAARVENLIPMQLRGDAAKFIEFMEDYYTFMNQYESPSQIISKANEQHDLDQIEEKYLEDIQSLLAPYIPFNLYGNVIKDKKRFFRLLVRYFYTSRGSRQSIHDFFRIFFNEEVEIIENIDRTILLGGSDLVPGDSQSMMDQWGPYSYGLGTPIPVARWYIPYKALVHPLGWRFFAYVIILLNNDNVWAITDIGSSNPDISQYVFDYSYIDTKQWFVQPPFGAHSPTSQPDSIYRNRYILELTQETSIVLDITGRLIYNRVAEILLYFSTPENVSHMVLTKLDYVSSLKCLDQTPAGLHQYLTFASTTQPFSYDYVNDFMNVSSEVILS